MLNFYFYFSLLAIAWCLAALVKVIEVRGRGANYRFTWWDGGMMLNGKELGPSASWGFAAFSVGLLVLSAYSAVRLYSVAW